MNSFLFFFHFPPSSLSLVFLPSPYQLEDFTVQWKHLSVEQRYTCWTVCWVCCCYKITLNVHRCLREWVGVLVCVILCGCMGVCVCGCHSGAFGGEETGNARCASAWPLSNWGAGVTWGGTSCHMIWTWWVACLEAKSNIEIGFFQRQNMIFLFFLVFRAKPKNIKWSRQLQFEDSGTEGNASDGHKQLSAEGPPCTRLLNCWKLKHCMDAHRVSLWEAWPATCQLQVALCHCFTLQLSSWSGVKRLSDTNLNMKAWFHLCSLLTKDDGMEKSHCMQSWTY